MRKHRWAIVASLLLLALSSVLAACASTSPPRFGPPPWSKSQRPEPPAYRTNEFTVPAGQAQVLTVNGMRAGGILEGHVEIAGEGGNELGFRVRGPSGDSLLDVPRVEQRHEFRLEAKENGSYQITLDNAAWPDSPKRVTLVWRGYWMGK